MKKPKSFRNRNKLQAFFETSAKTGNNVELAFVSAAKQLYRMHSKDTGIGEMKTALRVNRNGRSNSKKLNIENHKEENIKNGRKKKKKCC